MKTMKSLIPILLLVSLGFNAFFIGGYLTARSTLRNIATPEGRIRLLSRKFDLTDSQETQIRTYWREYRQKTKEFEQLNDNEISAFWEEIVKDDPDSGRLAALTKAMAEQREDTSTLWAQFLVKTFSQLDPQQRRELARMIRDRSVIKNLL